MKMLRLMCFKTKHDKNKYDNFIQFWGSLYSRKGSGKQIQVIWTCREMTCRFYGKKSRIDGEWSNYC